MYVSPQCNDLYISRLLEPSVVCARVYVGRGEGGEKGRGITSSVLESRM